jgi:hypothetical protein
MPKGTSNDDKGILSMALVGYETEKQRIDEKIAEIRARLSGRSSAPASTPAAPEAGTSAPASDGPKKRILSPAARKRIAAAQKKRWAEHRKNAALAKE